MLTLNLKSFELITIETIYIHLYIYIYIYYKVYDDIQLSDKPEIKREHRTEDRICSDFKVILISMLATKLNTYIDT